MVRDFYAAERKSEQVIAQLAGLLASTQSLGRAIASFPWGMISDVVGRKVLSCKRFDDTNLSFA